MTLGAAGNTSRLKLMFEGFTAESGLNPYAPAAEPWQFTARAPRKQAELETVLAEVDAPESWYAGQFLATANALDGHGGREVTLTDGRRSLELVTAIYASARHGQAVDLPIKAEHPMYDGWLP